MTKRSLRWAAIVAFVVGFLATISLAAQDSVTVVVAWPVAVASDGRLVADYEIDARASTLLSAVQDYANPDGGDRTRVQWDTVTATQNTFKVARPDCCSPLYVGVRVRGLLDGASGPWTNPAYPTVALENVPLTIPQVRPTIDTLVAAVPPGQALLSDTAAVMDPATQIRVGSVWAGAPSSIVGRIRLIPADPALAAGTKITICAYADVTKTWDDGNDWPWAWNWGIEADEQLQWGASSGLAVSDWRTDNGWADNPAAPSWGQHCVALGRA